MRPPVSIQCSLSLCSRMYRNAASRIVSVLAKSLVGENRIIDHVWSITSSYSYTTTGQPRLSSSSSGTLEVKEQMGDSGKPITRVIFCGPNFPASHNYTKDYLQAYSFIQVDVVPFKDVPDVIGNYDMCVVKDLRLTSDIISRANQMKIIMQFGVGLEGVDIKAATNCGIKVARIPSDATGNATSCAEMAIYLMLGLLRKQYDMRIAVRQKQLGNPIGDTLIGKTVFLMGFGNIGIHLAKRLRPFGVKILATKRTWPSPSWNSGESVASFNGYGKDDDLVDEKGGHGDILKFASQADIVVCCLSLNSETFVYKGFFQVGMAKVVGDVALQLHAGTSLTGIEMVN